MIRPQRRIWVIIVLMIGSLFECFAQKEIPLIRNIQPSEYESANQNWSVCQDWNGFIFVANHKCILRYNGLSWDRIYPFGEENQSIIRSVFSDNDAQRLYIGSFREFGFISFNETGQYAYNSVAEQIRANIGDNDSVWSIARIGDKIYFFCFTSYYCFDTVSGNVLRYRERWRSSFRCGEDFCISNNTGIILKLDGASGTFSRLFADPLPSCVLNAFENEDGSVIAVTESSGIIKITKDGKRVRLDGLRDDWPTANRVIRTESGTLVVGTIERGVFAFNDSGDLLWELGVDNGLINNTVLGMTEDNSGNIWLALDKGVSVVVSGDVSFIPISIREAGKKTALLITENHDVYLGTNQGLFSFSLSNPDGLHQYQIKKQVWSLSEFESQVFVGANKNTYNITDGGLSLISTAGAGSEVRYYTTERGDYLVQGTNSNINIYERGAGGKWQFRNQVSGFSQPVVRLEVDFRNEIWAEHRYRGLYRITLSDDLQTVDTVAFYPSLSGGAQERIHLSKIEGRVVFFNGNGFYTYDDLTNSIKTVRYLNDIDPMLCRSDAITAAGKHSYWAIGNGQAILFECVSESASVKDRIVFSDYSLSVPEEWGKVTFDDGRWVFTTDEGLLLYRSKEQAGNSSVLPISIIAETKKGEVRFKLSSSEITVPNRSTVKIEFGKTGAMFGSTDLSYLLRNYDKDIRSSRGASYVEYQNLGRGHYVLEVYGNPYNLAIKVKPPFLMSTPMIILYVLLLLGLIGIALLIVRNEMEKQRRLLLEENRKALLAIKNDQLEQSLLIKSQELAAYSLVEAGRNDVLGKLMTVLNRIRYAERPGISKADYDELSSIIRDGSFSEDNWKRFYDNFDLIHKSFFRDLVATYDDLSTNDLRLCAYLRQYMPSKEIASLLGITPKSVDQAKYRLRKKMNVSSDIPLEKFLADFSVNAEDKH